MIIGVNHEESYASVTFHPFCSAGRLISCCTGIVDCSCVSVLRCASGFYVVLQHDH